MDITAFTIILSFIGIIISFLGLIFAIVFLISVFKLSKKVNKISEIEEILISSLIYYSEDGQIIKGKKVLNMIKEKYDCDNMMAIKLYYSEYNK